MSFNVNNRRYTGCKSKLTQWIRKIILDTCGDCSSFAGTSVVTETMINDFLYSNEDNLEFSITEKCPPFGKKLKEIIESEFNKNSSLI